MTVSFEDPVTIPAGDGPWQVVLADFNGDSKLDLAVATAASHRVGIRLGNGDGTFGDETHVVAGATPVALLAADLNGDGKVDLAVDNAAGNNLSVMLGNGDGTFQPPTQYAAGGGPRAVTASDLDGDGKLDLIVGNQGNDVGIYRGRGDGTFDPQINLGLDDQANGVFVADMNEDGSPDILVAGYFELHLYLNDGAGHFSGKTSFNSTGGGGLSVHAADVNGDGHLDAVRANSANNFVSAYLGDGQGGLDGPFVYTVGEDPPYNSTGEYPYYAEFADLDLDGHPDLVIASNRGVVVRPGGGDGTFPDRLDFARGHGPGHLAIGDLNGDGRPDVVTPDFDLDQLTILLNDTEEAQVVGLSVGDVTILEGDFGTTAVPVTVQLSAPATTAVSVRYRTVDGTAAAGVDYTPVSGVLTFAPGETTQIFHVPVLGDLSVDGTRTINVTLDSPTGATIEDGSGVVTVQDSERPSVFRFGVTQVVVSPSADTAVITVERDDTHSDGVTVRYATIGGDAVPGVDYTPVQGTLRFSPGQTSLSFTVPILGDAGSRNGRTIGLTLFEPVGGTLGTPSTASIQISASPVPEPVPVPTPVRVESVSVESRRGGAINAVVVTFSGDLDPRSAGSIENYRLVGAGRDGRLGTRDDRRFAIKSAIYYPETRTVSLVPRQRHIPATSLGLTVTASVTDAQGFAIDGDRNGLPGGDYQATIRRGWYAVTSAAPSPRPPAVSQRFRSSPSAGHGASRAGRGAR